MHSLRFSKLWQYVPTVVVSVHCTLHTAHVLAIWHLVAHKKHKTEEELPPHLAQGAKNSAVRSNLRYLGEKLDLNSFSGHFSSGEKYQKDTKKAVLDSFFQAEFPCDTK